MAEQSISTGIDHPIIAVRDMAAGRAAYERLGFTVTPRGRHREWGTGNWCIMFGNDYLELRGIIDPATQNPAHRLPDRDGLMGLALGTHDAEATYVLLTRRGLQPQPVKRLARDFELPEGWVRPRFSLCFLDAADTPGLMSVVICQHLTPELLRRPDWLRHANGACGVRAVTGVVPDLAAAAECHAKLFGLQAITRQNDGLKIQLNTRQSLSLITPDAARELRPEIDQRASGDSGFLFSVTLEVKDSGMTEKFFGSRGIDSHRASGAIRISPRHSCGAPLEFIGRE